MSSLVSGCSNVLSIQLEHIISAAARSIDIDYRVVDTRLCLRSTFTCSVTYSSTADSLPDITYNSTAGDDCSLLLSCVLGISPTLPIQLFIEINLKSDYSSRERIPHYCVGPSACVSLSANLRESPGLAQTALSSFTLSLSIWSSPPPPVSLLSLPTASPTSTFFFCYPPTSSVHIHVCFSPQCHWLD